MPDARLPVPHASARAAKRARARLAGALLPATLALLAGCAGLPAGQACKGDTNAPSAVALAHEAAQQRLHAAVQAAQPAQDRLATARRALESLLADDGAEARALHPYARALLEQIRERQQLAALAERLRRQLDERAHASAAQEQDLDALRRRNAELQRKLEALAEIERGLAPAALPVRPRTGLSE
ncbi:MAG: hypothetical protein KUL79_11050 [Thauera sp.]|nr:hypothetical protein [Thauera sp.]